MARKGMDTCNLKNPSNYSCQIKCSKNVQCSPDVQCMKLLLKYLKCTFVKLHWRCFSLHFHPFFHWAALKTEWVTGKWEQVSSSTGDVSADKSQLTPEDRREGGKTDNGTRKVIFKIKARNTRPKNMNQGNEKQNIKNTDIFLNVLILWIFFTSDEFVRLFWTLLFSK